MTTEERKAAYEAMLRALSPRDKNGNIVPMVSYNGPVEELYYPCFLPDQNGNGIPMVGLEDFANGNMPPGLTYRPGYQLRPVLVDSPAYLSSIIYTDPVLNLPHRMQHMIHKGTEPDEKPVDACSGHSRELETKQMPTGDEQDPDIEIINTAKGLVAKTSKGDFLLTNFSIEATEHRIVHNTSESEDVVDKYEIKVNVQGRTKRLVLEPTNIDNVISIIQRGLPMCTVSTSVKRPAGIIVNYVRKQLFTLPERHYVEKTGFVKISGQWVFAHDGAELAGVNVTFTTGMTIPVNPDITPRGAYRSALEFLDISEKKALMLPLVLMAHLGPMFNLFGAAGYVPRFLLFLNGRSGSLKTSVSRAASSASSNVSYFLIKFLLK